MPPRDVPVLVVGAGPVGLTAAILLGELGVDCSVIDRRDGPHRAPQAHVVNPRTLEIFRNAGLDMAKLRSLAAPREDGSTVRWTTTLTGEEIGSLPYERQGDDVLDVSPTPLLNLPQHLLEPELLGKARSSEHVTVAYRKQWESLEQTSEGVTAKVLDLATGDTETLRSRYLLAADGAGSRVRKQLGIGVTGPDRIQSFVMIHFEANLRDLVRDRPAMLYWTMDPECPGAFVAHDIDASWVFMHPFDSEKETPAAYPENRCADLVRRAIGRSDVDLAIRDVSTWMMTAQVADRYGDGRVFLIGDSAHRFPPTGGMGMNTGIQDAHNLVWKLVAVEHGVAPRELLDSYEIERRPVAEHNAEQSLTNAFKMLEVIEALGLDDDVPASKTRLHAALADPESRARVAAAIEGQRDHFDMFGLHLGFSYEAGALTPDGTPAATPANPVRDYLPSTRPGGRTPHAWVEVDGNRVSMLDLLPYDRFTLITGRRGEGWARAAESLDDPTLRCLVEGGDFADDGRHWRAVSGIGEDGALLVRPDQHVAWRSSGKAPADADARAILRQAVSSALGRAEDQRLA